MSVMLSGTEHESQDCGMYQSRRWCFNRMVASLGDLMMPSDYEVLGCASGSHHCFYFLLCLHRLIHREVPVAVSIE
jgi:hypothetical protein